jgi:DNA-binding MarR family transcriptional regulator
MRKRKAAADTSGGLVDHVDRIHGQWKQELPEIDLDGNRIMARARRITLLSRPQIEAVFSRHGMDAGEFDVLATLRRSGAPYALRPTELYRSLMITSGGLTDRLMRLEERGLVRRRVSREDRRSLLVELTAAGCTCAEAAFCEDMVVENAFVARLSAHERDELARLLQKLAFLIEESIQAPSAESR